MGWKRAHKKKRRAAIYEFALSLLSTYYLLHRYYPTRDSTRLYVS